MSKRLYSPHWYRVAKLTPKLHSHLEIHRHDYRGLIWYIVEDSVTGRNHRFNPAAYQLIGLLDGQRTVQEIAEILGKQLGDFAPGQDEIIHLIGQLHQSDLLQSNAVIDTEELFERQVRQKQAMLNKQFLNPVSQKLPIWDPDDFLEKYLNKVAWLFTPWISVFWVLVLVVAGLQAASQWDKITGHLMINEFLPRNYLELFLLYPLIKILHELGHAFATKFKGGEVHEMGINFLMFMPIPYVNVSSSSHFRSKYDRMLVSAAGVMVESFLAGLSTLVFLSTEKGFIQDVSFNILLIGGVSSLFFNGNPLLKYDGYYFLADALGIPNLYQRAAQFWQYLFQRYLMGIAQVASPAMAPGESFWFVAYSLASLIYRLIILWFICVYLTEKFFALGVLLALWLAGAQVIFPVYKAVRFVIVQARTGNRRSRAAMSLVSALGLIVALFCFMPVNSYTMAEGIVWLPDEALIKAEQDGFIGDLMMQSNQSVSKGDVVATINDDTLETKAKVARAKMAELQSRFRSERETDLVKADIIKEELRVAESELDHLNDKLETMTVRAAKNGHILLPEANDLPGRYVHHGELIGYILDNNPPTIRMVITQDNIGQLREHIASIQVRLANETDRIYDATLIRQAPEAVNRLPSAALATAGGGRIQVDPASKEELTTLQKVFWADLKFFPENNAALLGTRAYVRINHGGEPLSKQWYRRIRQAFLRQFNV